MGWAAHECSEEFCWNPRLPSTIFCERCEKNHQRRQEEIRMASRENAGYDSNRYTPAPIGDTKGQTIAGNGAQTVFTTGATRSISEDKPFQEGERTQYPSETRTVDPITGGQKGSKLARFSLIPRDFLWALAEHYGAGARKYEDRNWEKGYKWSLSVDALDRHLNAWLLGEDNDVETGSSHLVSVAWHAIALWWWHKRGLGTNDVRSNRRPTTSGVDSPKSNTPDDRYMS